MTVGVAFITHCAVRHLPHCLPPILASRLKPKVLVVNSSSNDGTVEMAKRLGAETLVIARSAFNHGTTREQARKALGTDIVAMMTPDAYAVDASMLEKLVAPIMRGETAAAYARQIPHDGASIFEAFARAFNYPADGHVRSLDDLAMYGSYLFFFSDSCSAYSNVYLDNVGGFPRVLLGEDTAVCAKLLRSGHSVAYVADAVVKHSHRYTLFQEFQRHFDTGLARKGLAELIAVGGGDEARGKQYAAALLRTIAREKPALLLYAAAQILAKWLGYKAGRVSNSLPVWWKRALSGQDFYWE